LVILLHVTEKFDEAKNKSKRNEDGSNTLTTADEEKRQEKCTKIRKYADTGDSFDTQLFSPTLLKNVSS